jgi:hypothetical protein
MDDPEHGLSMDVAESSPTPLRRAVGRGIRASHGSTPAPLQDGAEASFEGFARDVPAADHYLPAASPDAIDRPTSRGKNPAIKQPVIGS